MTYSLKLRDMTVRFSVQGDSVFITGDVAFEQRLSTFKARKYYRNLLNQGFKPLTVKRAVMRSASATTW